MAQYLGNSPYSYVLLCVITGYVFTVFSLVDVWKYGFFTRLHKTPLSPESSQGVDLTPIPLIWGAAWIAASVGIASWWFSHIPDSVGPNFKVVWLMTIVYCSMSGAFWDWFKNAMQFSIREGWLPRRRSMFSVVPEDAKELPANDPRNWGLASYAFMWMILAVEITMGTATAYLSFTGGDRQPSSTAQVFLGVTGGLLVAGLVLEAGRVFGIKHAGNDEARGMYEGLGNNKILSLNIQINDKDLSKFAGKTVKFAQTGDRQYPLDDPAIAVLHHIEKEVARIGPKYQLSVKNYAAVQVGHTPEYKVLAQEDAAMWLSQNHVSSIHRPKYGLMSAHSGYYNGPGSADAHLNSILQAREGMDGQVPILSRVYLTEPCAHTLSQYVCAFGPGYGMWYNLSYWFPWTYALYFLAASVNTFHCGADGYAYAFIMNAVPLYIHWKGYEGQWFQVTMWNQLIVSFAIIVCFYFGSGEQYIMRTGNVYDNTTAICQVGGVASVGDGFDAQISTYTAFSSATLFFIGSMATLWKRAKDDPTSAS